MGIMIQEIKITGKPGVKISVGATQESSGNLPKDMLVKLRELFPSIDFDNCDHRIQGLNEVFVYGASNLNLKK